MKRAILAGLVLIVLTTARGLAAEPAAESKAAPKEKPSPKASADALEPLSPERELTFEVSEEEVSRKLTTPDPGLLEQRYVAVFRSEIFSPKGRSLRVPLERDLRELSQEVFSMGTPTFSRPYTFPRVLANVPQEHMPAEDIRDVLSAYIRGRSAYFTHRQVPMGDRYDRKYYQSFELMAPSPERAEELVRGLLSLYDYGVYYPIQRECLRLKRESEGRLPKYRATLKEAEKELAESAEQLEQLKEYEDVNKEALVHFTTQLRLISVDLAGIRARIEACNKILAKPVKPSRVEQVETVKITAEIELVGVEARKAAIEEIVEKGRRRVELLGSAEAARKKVSSYKSTISSRETRIAGYEADRRELMPFPIQDGKVTIHPIKWVSR